VTEQGVSRAQIRLALLVGGIAVASILYRVVYLGGMDQTAALFVGLPGVLAVVVALTPRAGSATGMAIKATTILLLIAGPLYGEGFVCILFISPLFYLVAVLVGGTIDAVRRWRSGRASRTYAFVLLPVLLASLSLEGTTSWTTLARSQSVTATRVVAGTPRDVERSLAGTPRFDRPLPRLLRLGFPRPVAAEGSGLRVGDVRSVVFESRMGKAEVVFAIAERRPGFVRFRAVADRTPIARWLGWRDAIVRWRAVGAGRTEVRWTVRFTRELDPAWYFGPWERYGARTAAAYLIDTLATP
jgi:hypothetical protein